MRRAVLGLVLASFVATAAAGQADRTDSFYDGNDYSARAYYRLDFGGATAAAQTVGLRFDNELASSRGAPAVFQLAFDGSGAPSAKLYGLELRGPALAAGDSSGGFFSSLSGEQWAGLSITALVMGIAISTATKKTEASISASGGS